jgi:hypothetical protein
LGKLKEIITISLCYRVLTGRRRKAEKSMFFFFQLEVVVRVEILG